MDFASMAAGAGFCSLGAGIAHYYGGRRFDLLAALDDTTSKELQSLAVGLARVHAWYGLGSLAVALAAWAAG
jgi:hypothetical protein